MQVCEVGREEADWSSANHGKIILFDKRDLLSKIY